MIVDCHTHISFDEDGLAVSKHLAASETVDACIVMALPSGMSEIANQKLSEYVGQYEKFVGFAAIDPTSDDISPKSLKAIKSKLGLKGFVVRCCGSGFHPANTKAMQFYQAAADLAMPVFFANSGLLHKDAVLDYVRPYLLDEVARKFPDLKIIIGSMGRPFIEQTLLMVEKHDNVFADLTIRPNRVWQVYNTVVAAYERGVMQKLLFGSGFPVSTAGACIETLLGFNKLLANSSLCSVPRGEIRGIIERDSLKLLGIDS